MPTVKIDETLYDLKSLSEAAKADLNMLKATEIEIRRLQSKLAMLQTARNAYMRSLKAALPGADKEASGQSDLRH